VLLAGTKGDSGGERFGDGVDAVEGSGQDEVIVCRDFGGGRVGRGAWVGGGEVSVVDEAAGFVDDEEGVNCPMVSYVNKVGRERVSWTGVLFYIL
jgi:hypothetical protein